jgi:hypothetical protein
MTVPVPQTLAEALSPQWLTKVLGSRFPGIEVTAVHAGPVDERITTNAQFAIECAGAVSEGLSPHLCVKGYFREDARGSGVGATEVYFYRDALPEIGVPTLRLVWAGLDQDGRCGTLLTEDVVAAGGHFLDPLQPYTPDMAAVILSDLAQLHATTWCRDRWEAAPWLGWDGMASRLRVRGEKEIRDNFEGPIGAGVPDEVRDPARLVAAYRAMATRDLSASPWCVIHGDPHPSNLFVDGTGRPGLLDWQLVQRANWFHDVGYHLAAALTVEDRREHETDLLEHYLRELSGRGVEAPTLDEARPLLAHGILLGFFLWGITQRVDPRFTSTLLTRIGTAAADHEVFTAMEPRPV